MFNTDSHRISLAVSIDSPHSASQSEKNILTYAFNSLYESIFTQIEERFRLNSSSHTTKTLEHNDEIFEAHRIMPTNRVGSTVEILTHIPSQRTCDSCLLVFVGAKPRNIFSEESLHAILNSYLIRDVYDPAQGFIFINQPGPDFPTLKNIVIENLQRMSPDKQLSLHVIGSSLGAREALLFAASEEASPLASSIVCDIISPALLIPNPKFQKTLMDDCELFFRDDSPFTLSDSLILLRRVNARIRTLGDMALTLENTPLTVHASLEDEMYSTTATLQYLCSITSSNQFRFIRYNSNFDVPGPPGHAIDPNQGWSAEGQNYSLSDWLKLSAEKVVKK